MFIFQTRYGIGLKLTEACGMKNGKSQVTDFTQRTVTLTSRDRDKYSDWCETEPKIAAG